jgi:hypothetical protein
MSGVWRDRSSEFIVASERLGTQADHFLLVAEELKRDKQHYRPLIGELRCASFSSDPIQAHGALKT